MGKCLDDLRKNYSRGLSENEIEEIFDEARKLWKGVQASRKASNQNALAQQLAARMAQKEKIAAVIKKRNTYLQISRKAANLEYVLGNWQGREAAGLSALMVGGQRLRAGSRMSVDALRNGLKGEYLGGFLNDMEALGPAHLDLFRKHSMDKDIAIAMWSIDNPNAPAYTGPKEAMEIARVAHKWQEKARLDQNRVGGFISKEPGYIVRQAHDGAKIDKFGFKEWKDDISKRLDWKRTGDGRFDPQLNPNVTQKEIDDFLDGVYRGLVTGTHLRQTGADNPLASASRTGSLASKVSHERVLHFKDGASWFEYNAKYGTGTLQEAMLRGFSMAADNTALMQIFGPSPQSNLDAMINFIETTLNKRGDRKGAKKFRNKIRRLNNEMAELDGSVNIPDHSLWASVGRNVRAIQSMAKLGGALISAMTDVPVFAQEMAYQGKGYWASMVRGMALMVRGRGTLEQKRILSACGVFYDSMCGDIIARFSGADGPGKMAAMMRVFFKLNGLTWWTESWKKAATLMMAHDMAAIRGKAFSALSKEEKRLFLQYGIDDAQWDMLRKGRTMAADGRDYLTPEAAFDVTDAEITAYLTNKGMKVTAMRVENFREELAGRLRTLYRDRVQYAVLEPDARTNAILHQGQKSGSIPGELLRYATQFKSFPAVFMQRTMGREILGRGSDSIGEILRNKHGELSGLAGLIVMTTIFGYGAMTAKQLIAGKNPRELTDPDGFGGINWRTIMAAAVQGGGMGIYGDFLFGQKSRMGGTFASTAGGPTYSTLEDILGIYYKIREGEDFGASGVRTIFNNLPFNNLVYFRAAFDFTVMNNFYEYLNPGYLRRMRRRIEKENDQTFWHEPAMRWGGRIF